MIKIIQVYTPDILPYAKYSSANVSAYCMQHGYGYCLYNNDVTDRSPHWGKVYELMQHVPSDYYEWVVFLDSDIMVQHPNLPFELFTDNMEEQHMFGLCDDTVNGGLINTGAWIVRSCDESYELLERIWEEGERRNLQTAPYHEQDTLRQLMLEDEKVFDAVKIFPHNAFNSKFGDIKNTDFIAHYMATSMQERIEKMREYK